MTMGKRKRKTKTPAAALRCMPHSSSQTPPRQIQHLLLIQGPINLKAGPGRMTPQPLKFRADVEMKCFQFDGVLHIKEAMRKAEGEGNDECPVKIKLVAPPLYVLTTQTLDKYLRELDGLRSQLSVTQATAEASAQSAQSAQSQCLSLLQELDEKNSSLKEHEIRVNKLGKQLDHLQKDLQARELSQQQLKDEVFRIEKEIMHAVTVAGAQKDCELKKILDEVSPKNIENLNRLMNAKDEEITRLKDEIRFLSAHWTVKTKELESQLEKHRRTDQELKKRVLKLEFCLQEAKSQMRKLQRMGERRDKALKELREQVAMKQQNEAGTSDKSNFWESSGFKLVVSMSMLVLVVIAKR